MNKKEARGKNILILGGEGFIGRNLAGLLSEKHACFSAGTARSVFAKRRDSFIETNPYEKKIKNIYNVIIHLIDNKIDLKKFAKEEKKLIKNINLNRKNHLIIFSSAVIYADSNSEYGRRKLILEKIFENYCQKNKINLTVLRLFNIFGPCQLPKKQGSLIANIFINHLQGKTTKIKDLEALRDFIFSGDMAKLVEYIIKNKTYGKYDLASGKLVSIKKVINLAEEIAGKKIKINNVKEKEKIKSSKGNNFLASRIKLLPFKKSLKLTFDFYKKNLRAIKGEIYG